jgi:hypothetical protein
MAPASNLVYLLFVQVNGCSRTSARQAACIETVPY